MRCGCVFTTSWRRSGTVLWTATGVVHDEESVRNNARTVATTHALADAGYHTLKVWMVDPAVVVQKIVVSTASAPKATTYLGPPESFRR